MSRFPLTPLTLSLGLLAAAAHAGDGRLGSASPRASDVPRAASCPCPAAAAQIGRPVAVPAAAAATLDRPQFVTGPAGDPQVRPASYGRLFRAQAPDAKPMPAGPTPMTGAIPEPPGPPMSEPIAQPHDWQRTAAGPTLPTPTLISGPTPIPEAGPPPSDCGGCCGGDCGGRLWSWPVLTWFRGEFGCDCDAAPDACCDAGSCGDGCCDSSRFYVSGEYLLWWMKGDAVPPLVTAGSAGDLLVPGVSAGALDRPGTVTLFGGRDLNDRSRSGGRVMVGWWFGDEHLLGIEGGGFFLGRQTDNFSASSFGTPLLARPFFNVLTMAQDAEFVAEPGNPAVAGVGARTPLAGTVTSSVSSTFWGAEANLRTNLWCGPSGFVDLIGGYKHIGLDDTLTVSENLQAVPVAGAPFTFSGADEFKALNRFNGGQIGLKGEYHYGRWSVDGKTIIAIGNVSEQVNILGGKVVDGVPSGGDLLTQVGTNIGAHKRNRFAWSPDVGVNLGYQVTDHLRAFVGYDFVYLSDVVRAGDQVNLAVNPLPLAGMAGGPAQPAFAFHPSDFWAQGISFGLEFRY